jgi:hypothetical protein
MSKRFAGLKMSAAMLTLIMGVVTGSANATELVQNGNFCQTGINPSLTGPPIPNSDVSAALNWSQFVVAQGSYIATRVERFQFFDCALHVYTNGGFNPKFAMGNGVSQTFQPTGCAFSTFTIKVVSGDVTGNLITTTGHFVSTPHFTAGGSWKTYSQVESDVSGIGFETLAGPGAEYYIRDVSVTPCIVFKPAGESPTVAPALSKRPGLPSSPLYTLTDVSQYLSHASIPSPRNEGGVVETVRITNTSTLTIDGPLHIFLEGLTPGRGVVNPDGNYLGTPFITLASGSLAPGASEDVTLQLDANGSSEFPNFTMKLLASAR